MKRLLIPILLILGVLGSAALVYWRPKVEPLSTQISTAQPTAEKPASNPQPVPIATVDEKPKSVRVAAIQMSSPMGKMLANRDRMTTLAHQAASLGAKIVVFPECALQGYMDVNANTTWTRESEADENTLNVSAVAASVPSSLTRHFGELAKDRGLYIALPLVEEFGGKYFNSLVLLDPSGKIAAHHRKHSLWPPGDATWASSGPGIAKTVDSPYGRLGLMICFDLHSMPKKLKKAQAQIVLYSVGWYGPNVENWYRDIFPRRYVAPYHFAVVAANWAKPTGEKDWGGAGYSCVLDSNGGILSMAKTPLDEEIVMADIPLEFTQTATSPGVEEAEDE